MQAEQPLFQVENLSTEFNRRHFDFSLMPHEIMTIAGPSGSGKSLFLRALADMDKHQGEVFLSGEPQSEIEPENWRQQVVLVAAESAWWSAIVGDHFRHKPSEQQFADLGFDKKVLYWPVSRLSSGERQRLSLLRALVLKPAVLLLDEPTANLDEKNTLRVEKLLLDYLNTHRTTAVWVSHDRAQRERLDGKELILE